MVVVARGILQLSLLFTFLIPTQLEATEKISITKDDQPEDPGSLLSSPLTELRNGLLHTAQSSSKSWQDHSEVKDQIHSKAKDSHSSESKADQNFKTTDSRTKSSEQFQNLESPKRPPRQLPFGMFPSEYTRSQIENPISRQQTPTDQRLHENRTIRRIPEHDSRFESEDSHPSDNSIRNMKGHAAVGLRLFWTPFGSDPKNKQKLKELEGKLSIAAWISIAFTLSCLLISSCVAMYERRFVNKELMSLNEKLIVLETKLGQQQLPEALMLKLCAVVGLNYEQVKRDRQKEIEDLANVQQRLMNEVVNGDLESAYQTLYGLKDDVFGKAKDSTREFIDQKKAQGHQYDTYHAKSSSPDERKTRTADANEADFEQLRAGNDFHDGGVPIFFGAKINRTLEDRTQEGDQIGSPDQYNRAVNESPRNNMAKVEIRKPEVGGMVDADNVNYETLHGITNEEAFKK